MKNTSYDIDLGIIEKYHISPNELFVLRTLLITQENENNQIMFRFLRIPEHDRGDFRNILISLQNKGIINKSYNIPQKGEEFKPEEIPINKNLIRYFHKDSFDMGLELFEEYPQFGSINGEAIALRGVAKKFDSLEDFYRFYGKSIRWNPDTHKEIIELVRWAKEQATIINQSIASFVINQGWNDLKALKNGEGTNYNFDTVKLL